MKQILVFLYGVICYSIGFSTFLYMMGFIGNFATPTRLDAPAEVPLTQALLINVALVALFGIQHTIMARPGFKKAWTKIIPAAAERSTYVLFSSICMGLIFLFWQPMGGEIWNVQDPVGQTVLYAIYALGWGLLFLTTFLINHFDLFGLRQVWLYLRGKEYTRLRFVTPWIYKYIRHPLYVGWFTIFWATPTMSAAHLVFAIATSLYILIAIPFEERDLIKEFGETYIRYRREVPKFIPLKRKQDPIKTYRSAEVAE